MRRMERGWLSSRRTATRRIGEVSDGVERSCEGGVCARRLKIKDVYRRLHGRKRYIMWCRALLCTLCLGFFPCSSMHILISVMVPIFWSDKTGVYWHGLFTHPFERLLRISWICELHCSSKNVSTSRRFIMFITWSFSINVLPLYRFHVKLFWDL